MRVLIVVTKFGYPGALSRPEIFPQGPAYVAGALEAAGHQVFGCNMAYSNMLGDTRAHLQRCLDISIRQYQPDVVAMGGLTADFRFIRDAMAACRQIAPDLPLILGGGIVTSDRDYIMGKLRPDFAISGDAEIPIVELLAALEVGGPVDNIAGLLFWKDGQPVYTCSVKETKQLPAYARPIYDCLGIEDFFNASNHLHAWHLTTFQPRPRIFPVSAGRSCPFRCTFCFHSSGSVYKQRPIPEVLDEIAYFHDRHDFNFLLLYDELFSVNQARVREFNEGMRGLKLGIKWSAALRVPDVNLDLLRDMKDAGCAMVGVGLESASDRILDSMKKKIKKAQIISALEAGEQAGLPIQGNFIFGDPEETEETFRETMAFARDYGDKLMMNVGRIMPFPGSPIFDSSLEKGAIVSKDDYYETMGREYNMTDIPTPVFDGLMELAAAEHRSRLPQASVVPFIFLVSQPPGPFDDYPRSTLVALVICPHCEAESDRKMDYPGDIREVADGDEAGLMEYLSYNMPLLCPECGKQSRFTMQHPDLQIRHVSCPPGEIPFYGELNRLG